MSVLHYTGGGTFKRDDAVRQLGRGYGACGGPVDGWRYYARGAGSAELERVTCRRCLAFLAKRKREDG